MKEIKYLLFIASFFFFQACEPEKETVDPEVHLIPHPVHLEIGKGHFQINKNTKIEIIGENEQIHSVAEYFKNIFQQASGISLPLIEAKIPSLKDNIIIFKYADNLNSAEGYELQVTNHNVTIQAKKAAGLFYGVQTLRQLLPVAIDDVSPQPNVQWNIPAVNVEDWPRFSWRGMHLDVSRHFFPKEFIKKYIDHLARYKFNIFHWHLVDGPGWRLEIDRYPNLIEIASWRTDKREQPWNWSNTEIGKPTDGREAYGGHYSKEDIKEIVAYATERFIEVIPEIEMPGHSYAALVAYPELVCENNDIEKDGLRGKDVFCAANEKTYRFLEDVIDETAQLFPSKYIHLGGDEVDKSAWQQCGRCQALIKKEGLKDEKELQSHFIKNMASYIESRGKQVIGWDEILEGGIAENANIMSWRGMEGGLKAANLGHEVIMAPNTHTYLDLYQGDPDLEPAAYSKLLLSKVYQFDPIPAGIKADKRHHILGGHGCLWTENIQTPQQAEYMMFPRMLALAETVWSPRENLDWISFLKTMENTFHRFDLAGINYARSAYQVNINTGLDTINFTMNVTMDSEAGLYEIKYTLDGSEPTAQSTVYEAPLDLSGSTTIKAVTFKDGIPLGKVASKSFYLHIATGKNVKLKHPPSKKYTAGGKRGLVNGLKGTKDYNDGQWQGFQEDDFEAVIDFEESIDISTMTISFFQATNALIYLPLSVEFLVSEHGKSYQSIKKFREQEKETSHYFKNYRLNASVKDIRYLKIKAKNRGYQPERPDQKTWLLVDEIIVE